MMSGAGVKAVSLEIPKLEVTDNGSVDSAEKTNSEASVSALPSTPTGVKKLGIKKAFRGRFKGSGESLEGSGVSDDGGEYGDPSGRPRHLPPGRPKHFNKVLQQIRERATQKRRRSKTSEEINGKSPGLTVPLYEEQQYSESPTSRVRSATTLSTTDEECFDGDSLDDAGSYGEGGGGDEGDSGIADSERKKQAVEHLRYKVDKYREQIRLLQEERDESVKEYLESTEGMHNQRVKTNFEKKNQKTNATIAALQKKLEKYHKALVDLEQNGVSPTTAHSAKESAKEVFRGVKENIRGISGGVRDGVKAGLSGAVSKPLEIANLIKNKFGSSENILTKGDGEEDGEEGDRAVLSETERTNLSPRYNSDDDNSSIASATHLSNSINVSSPRQSTVPSPPWFEHEVTDLKDNQITLGNVMDAMKHEISVLAQSLQDERYKSEYLQCQLNDLTSQWNDLTELHQNEIMALKQELERAEERIECVEYRSAERAGEIEEALDTYVTRITKMEALQQQSQQMVTIDDYFDQSVQARALLSKLLSFILAIFAIILIIFTTIARTIGPFTRTRFRVLLTSIAVGIFAFAWTHQDHHFVLLIRSYLKSHLQEPWEFLKSAVPLLGWMFDSDAVHESLGNASHTESSVR